MSTDFTIAAAIDLNDDGDFGDTYEDVSTYLREAEWWLGVSRPDDFMAADSGARLVLDNADRRFSPEYASGALYGNLTIDRPVRIQTTKDGSTRTMQVGWIKNIRPSAVRFGPMTAEINVEGWLSKAANVSPVDLELLTDQTTDQALIAILEAAKLYPAGMTGKWVLGISELGENTALGGIADYFTYETGRATLNIVGDWSQDVSLLGAIRNVMGREGGGLLYLNRSGNLVFLNARHFAEDLTADATFSGYMQAIDYRFGDYVFNKVVIPVRTKKHGETPERLCETQGAIRVPGGGGASASVRFVGPDDGAKISGRDLIDPIGGVDFEANSSEDGTGSDQTSSVTASITNSGGQGCTVRFTSVAPMDVWIQAGWSVRGTKVTDYGHMQAVADDNEKVTRQKVWPIALDDLDYAERLAAYRLRLHRTARGVVTKMSLTPGGSDTLLGYALALTIGDRIRLTEAQTGLADADYFIVGERHHWRAPRHYSVEWTLLQAESLTWWVLGDSTYGVLGETTRPIPV